jgi:cell division septum initiation protein DivIVA
MESKIDKILERIGQVELNLAVNNNILERLTITVEQHEARSTALERQVRNHEREMEAKLFQHDKASDARWAQVSAELNEAKAPVSWLVNTAKVVGVIVTVLTGLKLLGYL